MSDYISRDEDKTIKKKDYCHLCRHVISDTHREKDNNYYCVNNNSASFGSVVGFGCEYYERFDARPNMTFKDALAKILLMDDTEGCYPDFWFQFNRDDDISRPFMCISFPDNYTMQEWRDAHMRCFEELMEMETKDGGTDEHRH